MAARGEQDQAQGLRRLEVGKQVVLVVRPVDAAQEERGGCCAD